VATVTDVFLNGSVLNVVF